MPINISIHALREEGDYAFQLVTGRYFVFLSTPSARRATRRRGRSVVERRYFYPRPPRGGRQGQLSTATANSLYFYPRPPRGGRPVRTACALLFCKFLSTPSARRATRRCSFVLVLRLFLSTPSARRATPSVPRVNGMAQNFYPRPPRGGRRLIVRPHFTGYVDFYPRPPRGGRLFGVVPRFK